MESERSSKDDPYRGARWIEERPAPGAPILIELPSSGRVVVTCAMGNGPDGRELQPSVFTLYRLKDDSTRARTYERKYTGNEVAERTFEHVEIGLRLECIATVRGGRIRFESGPFVGPLSPGETVQLKLQPVAREQPLDDPVRVEGVATYFDGRPLGSTLVELEATPRTAPLNKRRSKHRINTDPCGRFQVEVERDWLSESLSLEYPANHSAGFWPEAASVPTPAAAPDARVLNVGTLRLCPPEEVAALRFLVSGRLLDRRGNPVSGLAGNLRVESIRSNGRSGDFNGDGWQRIASSPCPADELGRFTIQSRAQLVDERLRISVHHPEFAPLNGVEVLAGSQDLVLVLDDALSLSVTVFTDEVPHYPGLYGLRLLDRSGRDRARWKKLELDGETDCVLPGLEVGEYRIQVVLNTTQEIVLERSIAVQEDLDLGVLDARGRTRVASARLIDEQGGPFSIVEVHAEAVSEIHSRAVRGAVPSNGYVDLPVSSLAESVRFTVVRSRAPNLVGSLSAAQLSLPGDLQSVRPDVVMRPTDGAEASER
ncbi:MAG: hypothetical protein AAFU73_10110 [Planctomycetota bacterium]